jgi:hypothetical protein
LFFWEKEGLHAQGHAYSLPALSKHAYTFRQGAAGNVQLSIETIPEQKIDGLGMLWLGIDPIIPGYGGHEPNQAAANTISQRLQIDMDIYTQVRTAQEVTKWHTGVSVKRPKHNTTLLASTHVLTMLV